MPKLVFVEWFDCTHYGDSSLSDMEINSEPLLIMQDVGFLVSQNKERIALAMEYVPTQDRYRHISWIPRVNVRRMEIISMAKKKGKKPGC